MDKVRILPHLFLTSALFRLVCRGLFSSYGEGEKCLSAPGKTATSFQFTQRRTSIQIRVQLKSFRNKLQVSNLNIDWPKPAIAD